MRRLLRGQEVVKAFAVGNRQVDADGELAGFFDLIWKI
jgi:hypothetical protein